MFLEGLEHPRAAVQALFSDPFAGGYTSSLAGCASAPPEARWPEQQVSIDDMQSTRPVILEAQVAADGKVLALVRGA